MALLLSHREMGVLERLERDTDYPVQKAITKVRKKESRDRLGVDAKGWQVFERVASWHNDLSHASPFVVASMRKFDEPETRFLAAGFAEAKIEQYRQVLGLLTSAAERLTDLVAVVAHHLRNAQQRSPDLGHAL